MKITNENVQVRNFTLTLTEEEMILLYLSVDEVLPVPVHERLTEILMGDKQKVNHAHSLLGALASQLHNALWPY